MSAATRAQSARRAAHVVTLFQRAQLSRLAGVVTVTGLAIVAALFCDAYWTKIATATVIYVPVAAATGLLYSRLGLVSLCQVALLGCGGWVALWLSYHTALPYAALLVIAGLVTSLVGVAICLPALLLSGLHLALVTLMAAAAAEVILQARQFPHGASGAVDSLDREPMRRPGLAVGDHAYNVYCVAVAALLLALLYVHLHGRPGRAWAAIGQGDALARSVGIGVASHKMWAIALASLTTGVCGALLAGSVGSLDVSQFRASASVVLFVVVLVGGAYSLYGAIMAGAFANIVPALFATWQLSQNLVLVLFGVGALQVLTMQPQGLSGQVQQTWAALRSFRAASAQRIRAGVRG